MLDDMLRVTYMHPGDEPFAGDWKQVTWNLIYGLTQDKIREQNRHLFWRGINLSL